MSMHRAVLLGLGITALGALGAHGHRVFAAQEPPEPPPLFAARVLPSLSILAATAPRPDPTVAMIDEIRRACDLLKAGQLTARQVAERLGAVTEDDPQSTIGFRPRVSFFMDGRVARRRDVHWEPMPGARTVSLMTQNPRQLPLSAIQAAFGKPTKPVPGGIIDGFEPDPLRFLWRKQPMEPGSAVRCEIGVDPGWAQSYGAKENVVLQINVSASSGG